MTVGPAMHPQLGWGRIRSVLAETISTEPEHRSHPCASNSQPQTCGFSIPVSYINPNAVAWLQHHFPHTSAHHLTKTRNNSPGPVLQGLNSADQPLCACLAPTGASSRTPCTLESSAHHASPVATQGLAAAEQRRCFLTPLLPNHLNNTQLGTMQHAACHCRYRVSYLGH